MREFWERGYRDTSVDDLVEATGVQPGSLYNAFPGGKRALFLRALDRYSKLVVPQKLGALEEPGAGLEELRGYFDGLVEDLTTREGRMGCLMVNSTIELAAEDSEVSVWGVSTRACKLLPRLTFRTRTASPPLDQNADGFAAARRR